MPSDTTSGITVYQMDGLLSRDHWQTRLQDHIGESHTCRLVYFWPSDFSAEEAFLQIVHLLQALASWEGRCTIDLTLLTQGASGVMDEAVVDPAAAMAAGIVEVIRKEWPHIRARVIDMCPPQVSVQAETGTGHVLPDEGDIQCLHALLVDQRRPVNMAIWQGRAWERSSRAIEFDDSESLPATKHVPADRGGFYVLVGGFGGIGRALARELAGRGARLLLTARSLLPSSDDRETLMQELRQMGATVETMEVDLAAGDSIDALIDVIAAAGEPCRAVLHLGGIVNDGSMVQKSDAAMLDVLNAKVSGSWTLYHSLLDRGIETTLLMFSSIAAWSGPAGQVDYAAANAYQMALAHSLGSRPPVRVQAIAWPGWRDTGMMARIADRQSRDLAARHGLSSEEGLDLLAHILDSDHDAVWVSPCGMEAFGQSVDESSSAVDAEAGSTVAEEGFADIGLVQGVEQRIRRHWMELLGFDELGNDEDFFEIGGTSLVAVKLCSRIEREFGVEFPVEDMITSNTITLQAERIHSQLPAGGEITTTGQSPSVTDRQETTHSGETTSLSMPRTPSRIDPLKPSGMAAAGERPSVTESTQEIRPSLVPLTPQSGNQALPVYLMHAHGGMVVGYQRLAREIGRSRPVFGLQARGVRGDTTPLETIDAMAEVYASEIRAHSPGPYILGGYCMGGTIAWEVARRLEAAGGTVRLVFLLQSFHKDLDYPIVQNGRTVYPRGTSLMRRVALFKDKAVEALQRHYGGEDISPLAATLSLASGASKRLLRTIGQRRSAAPHNEDATVEPGLNAVEDGPLLAVHRANGDAFYRYDPPAQSFPVVFFSAEHQPVHIRGERTLGWYELAGGWRQTRAVAGSFLLGLEGLDLESIARDLELDIAAVTDLAGAAAEVSG